MLLASQEPFSCVRGSRRDPMPWTLARLGMRKVRKAKGKIKARQKHGKGGKGGKGGAKESKDQRKGSETKVRRPRDPPSVHASDHASPTLQGRQPPATEAVPPATEAVSWQLQGEVLAQVDSASQALLHSKLARTVAEHSPACRAAQNLPTLLHCSACFCCGACACLSCRCDRLLDPLGPPSSLPP